MSIIANSLRVWYENPDKVFVPLDTSSPVWLSQSTRAPSERRLAGAVSIRPITPRDLFICVAIVPPSVRAGVAINGTPIGSGLHGLRHGDRLDVNGHRIWAAANRKAEMAPYDPIAHGERQFCFISKMPLAVGQEIVLCPGAPGKPCNVIYARQSWEMAMQVPSRLGCANCGFHPDDAEWKPVDHAPRKRIDDILAAAINGYA